MQSRLLYFNISHQPKHTRDIASIVLEMGDALDLAYIAQWSERLGLAALWQEMQTQIRKRSA